MNTTSSTKHLLICALLAFFIVALSSPALAGTIRQSQSSGQDQWLSLLLERFETHFQQSDYQHRSWNRRHWRWNRTGGPSAGGGSSHPVPEPSGIALFAVGALAIRGAVRRH